MQRRRTIGDFGSLFPSSRRRRAKPAAGRPRSVSTEPLEERLMMALSKAGGGSGCSGTLSTNPTIRQQQLICDPGEPAQGSTSVNYDPSVVTLVRAQPGPGYANDAFQVLVEVEPIVIGIADGSNLDALATRDVVAQQAETTLVPLSVFLQSRGSFVEMGYVQVKYQLSGDAGQLQPPEGYVINDEAGVAGVDTHGLFFDAVGGGVILRGSGLEAPAAAAAVEPDATYTVFAAHGGTHGGNTEDFFITTDGVYIGPDEISPAVVTSNPVSGAPTAAATAPAEVCGGPVEVTLLATDPAPTDPAAGFTYLVDWGDGSPLLTVPATAGNGSGVQVSHDYADVGVFTVTVQAVDQHHEVSDPFITTLAVGGAELRPDPADPSKLALFVCGSDGDDTIRFSSADAGLAVSINGHNYGPFSGNIQRVIVAGHAGDDDIRFNAQGSYPVAFFGGAGDDTLVAGNGPSILSGGDGADQLAGGNGTDLVIGGRGPDTLQGGNGEDILIAGWTKYDEGTDADIMALSSILNEWARGGRYETRIDHLTGLTPGGLNSAGTFRLSGSDQNVFDDGATDRLLGGTGRDWLLLGTGDVSDLAKNELSTALV